MIKNAPLRLFFFLVILCAAGLLLRFSWQEQKTFLGMYEISALEVSRNAPILTYDAREAYLFDADLQRAERELLQALKNNTLYVPAWLVLASVLNDKGEKERANAILDYTGVITKDLLRWRWDRTLVAYELGREELLPEELEFIINRIGGKTQRSALELAFRLFPAPEDLKKNVGEGNLLYLFSYSISKKNVPFALYFLECLSENGQEIIVKRKIRLINMLISVGELKLAKKYWRKWFAANSIVYNGYFTDPLMRTAFGWRLGKNKDYVPSFYPDRVKEKVHREMQFRFKGWKNINFNHFYQIIPLEGAKRYQFSVLMRSQKLTTDKLPFFQITGYKCKMKSVDFEMVKPDQGWKRQVEFFDVPEECSAIVLRLRRTESRQIDSKMSGKFWIKDVKITDDCPLCGSFVSESKEIKERMRKD